MFSATPIEHSLYQGFDRQSWAELRQSVPLTLTDTELQQLRGINENISLTEVTEIYLPLTRLLNLIVNAKQQRNQLLKEFLGKDASQSPYIISIAGSVAVGKSTTARILQSLLQRWPEHPKVELVTTDGFLYPLATLEQKGLLQRKGFPESYDTRMLTEFLSAVKAGKQIIHAPKYSHITYDRCAETQIVNKPDILILEGLNVLQTDLDLPKASRHPFVSDFVDFSIYVDAEEDLLKDWYIARFLKLRSRAFSAEGAYFKHYADLSNEEAVDIATKIWDSINGPNLVQNILPTRERAHLILQKGGGHLIKQVLLRR